MVTSTADDGALHARPMTPQQVTDDLEAWFFISRTSEQATDLAERPRVNLSFDGSSDWLSVAGSATLVDDRRLVEEMWNPVVEAWFPDGPQDPDLVLLRVDAESAEYWKAPGGRAASLLSPSSRRRRRVRPCLASRARFSFPDQVPSRLLPDRPACRPGRDGADQRL